MKSKILLPALALSLITGTALAKVPESVANRLGQDLTPSGAEKAGSSSGVPAWNATKYDIAKYRAEFDGGALPDPFAADTVQYTITAENASQYDAVLTDGQKKMLETYPSTYKLNVFQGHRTCVQDEKLSAAYKRNALVGEAVDGGNGISEAIMASPFPIPNAGIEIVWNHTLRYRGERVAREFNYAVPTASGDYTLTFTKDEITFPYSWPENSRAEDLDNISIYFVATTTAPARNAGNVVLVHETLNMQEEGRKAWTYSPGTRRVRRAPNIAYDNPVTNGDGLGTSDQYDGYNGAPDRYDWKLEGKFDKLGQHNNYRAVMMPYTDLLQAGHSNPEAHRYEVRRQWVVSGNLKSTARHIYAKRVLRFDEDSWQISAGEMYDGRGELWRVQEIGQATDYRENAGYCWTSGGEFTYDTLAGRYLGIAMKSERPANVVDKASLEYLSNDYFTPSNVRNLGR
jgi:hypothetical protein